VRDSNALRRAHEIREFKRFSSTGTTIFSDHKKMIFEAGEEFFKNTKSVLKN
jgi:hypothetical protein